MRKVTKVLAKVSAAAAITASGVAITSTAKNVLNLTSTVHAMSEYTGNIQKNTTKSSTPKSYQATTSAKSSVFKVKINYVPGYGINIWNSYTHPHFTGVRAQHGTTWTVYQTVYDQRGRKWYQVGTNQWILAKYTVSANSKVASASTSTASANNSSAASSANSSSNASSSTSSTSSTTTSTTTTTTTTSTVSTSSSTQASSKAAAVVALAKAQVGKSYVWGATGPNSFDCSGLTQYVYKQAAGIDITRTTYSQVNQGRTVSMNSLQPGDLLFWGSASAPYHVAIYVGNNQYVNAATPDTGVVLQTISTYYYPTIAKRIL